MDCSPGQVLISIHSGSRALGHQIGTDYLPFLEQSSRKYGIPIRERELVCAPFKSPEGQQYFAAMKAGANCAYANRQTLVHLVRRAFQQVLGAKDWEIRTLYEVPHNIAKLEKHVVDGVEHESCSYTARAPPGRSVPAVQSCPRPTEAWGSRCWWAARWAQRPMFSAGPSEGLRRLSAAALHGAGARCPATRPSGSSGEAT